MDFINSYESFAGECTDAPKEFHTFVGYAIMAAAVGNRVFFKFGDLRVFPNIWALLIAPSSAFRKSTALSIGRRILSEVCPETVLPNEFSPEKLVELLAERPQGIFFVSEFLTLGGLLDREYMSGIKGFLTELYDSPGTYTRRTKSNNISIENPCVSIVAATTCDWFVQKVKESDLFGGFLPRYIYVPATKKDRVMPFPKPANQEMRARLLDSLKEIREIAGEVSFPGEALAYYESWFQSFERKLQHASPSFIAFYSRLEMTCLKLACLNEISKTRTLAVSREAMERACTTVDWLSEQLAALGDEWSFSPFQAKKKKTLRTIEQRSPISRSQLLRAVGLSAEDLDRVLRTLEQEGRVGTRTHQSRGTKPAKVYFYQDTEPESFREIQESSGFDQ